MSQGGVLLACDGLTALKQAQSMHPVDPNTAHYDLIRVIRTIRKELQIQITFEHVKGHQDSGQITALSQLATMNVEMDAAAKQRIKVGNLGLKRYQLPSKPWVCYKEGNRVITKIAAMLKEEINKITIEEHWEKKKRYKAGHRSMMDFKMAGRALRSLPKAQQCWATKTAA